MEQTNNGFKNYTICLLEHTDSFLINMAFSGFLSADKKSVLLAKRKGEADYDSVFSSYLSPPSILLSDLE